MIDGEKFKVKIVNGGIPGDQTGELMIFKKSKCIYLIPEYSDNTITYYIAYKLANIKSFEKDLARIKIKNLKQILEQAKIIDKKGNVILAKINGRALILTDNKVYVDKHFEQELKDLIKSLNE